MESKYVLQFPNAYTTNDDYELESLMRDVGRLQYNFVQFGPDMSKYLDQNDFTEDIDKYHMQYNRNMFRQCVMPLRHGVSKDSIVNCIGMYVGMSLISPEFRKYTNNEVNARLLPIVEKISNSKKSMSDMAVDTACFFGHVLQKASGKEMTWMHDLRERYDAISEKNDLKAFEYRNRILRAQHNGYLPMTPEQAALTQLSFIRQAYDAMRLPNANVDEIMSTYLQSSETLYQLVEQRDNISEDQLNLNVRIMAGRLIAQYPQMTRYFEELALQDVVQSKATKTYNGHNTSYVWKGEYAYADGSPYEQGFSPRVPKKKSDMCAYFEQFVTDAYADCHTISDIKKRQREMDDSGIWDYFEIMMNDDMPDTAQETYDAMCAIHKACGMRWFEQHPDQMRDMQYRTNQQTYQSESKDRGYSYDY